MYKVLVVDDEIAASKFICQILEKKCPEYSIISVAENGQAALSQIEECKPDVIISDIRMPVMDGIELIETVSVRYPDIHLILVTGYQEFEYAQKALRAGVSEYLLKPVKPKELQKLMENIRYKLDEMYYERRIRIFNKIIKRDEKLDKEEVEEAFECGHYYALLVRKNGLPKRFSLQNGVPVYSLANEQFFIYGRDEMEALYLIHTKYLMGKSLNQFADNIISRYKEAGTYITCIKYTNIFSIPELPEVVKLLYRRMDWEIVIGKDRILTVGKDDEEKVTIGAYENDLFEKAEYFIKYKELNKLRGIIGELFTLWEKENRTQMYVEKQLDHLFYLLNGSYDMKEQYKDIIFSLDDAFSYVSDMAELKEAVWQIICRFAPGDISEQTDDKEELFKEIIDYLDRHMAEEITLNRICRHFGISQTSLSRMFRKNEECSFSNYLMKMRIDRAKSIMEHDSEIFIKDVAERVGYKDQFYFSRIFRSVAGISPSEYIER